MAEPVSAAIARHMLAPITPGTETVVCALAVCAALRDMGWPWPAENLRACWDAEGTVLGAAMRGAAHLGWPEVDAQAPAQGDVGVVLYRDRTGIERQFLAIADGGFWCVKTRGGLALIKAHRAVRAWRPQ